MRSLLFVLSFVALTFLCWGNYGPLMHEGQHGMGESSLRPFIAVGMAYFLIAVVVPVVVLQGRGEKGGWTTSGAVWSLVAGAAGAVGALGIIMAFKFRGSPVYVMPLVFGGAPVVNTFVTMWMGKTYKEAGMIFYSGVVVVAIGAAGVMFFKPSQKNVSVEAPAGGPIKIVLSEFVEGGTQTTQWMAANEQELKTKPELAKAHKLYMRWKPLEMRERALIGLSIALTALCWGCYGPVLHKGQMKMSGSRLRPFLCVGLAYFGIAVVVPYVILLGWAEPGYWSWEGTFWSMGAGAAGAVGAMGIILAFNFGGKPIYVMPLVFGGAPVINTFTTIAAESTLSLVTTPFCASLLLVIAGAATVLIFQPKSKPHAGHSATERHEPSGKSERDRHLAEPAKKAT